MLLECSECQLPYYDFEDLQEHYEISHPKLHHQNNRLDVRIIKRILHIHQKTYRCPKCYMPFPHPDLRDSHAEFDDCNPECDSDCEKDRGEYFTVRRGNIDSIVYKIFQLRTRRGSSSSNYSSS